MVDAIQDEFERTTENPELVELLRRRIEAEGAITFHDFMETALYHPQHGYYTARQPMGREGDYLTSPEVHPIFGALVAKQLYQLWELMEQPERFDVVEQGAGSGLLARDILRWASKREPSFHKALGYRIVEISPALRRRQQETLAPPRAGIEWLEELPDAIEGCLLSNELIDSFPVHRIVHRDRQLMELYVTSRDGRFEEVVGLASTERIAEYFADVGLWPGDGCVAEVNLHAIDWMTAAAQALRRGVVLTFDYGYPAEELYAPWRRDGTLLCFYRHNASNDPYARIGKQDMTSHVDFTSLMRAGESSGLQVAGFTTQSRFLSNLGIGVGVDTIAKESPGALEEYYARRRAVQDLIDQAGLGRIRVLAQRKDVAPTELWGFKES
ncbi:MAG: SAM-dependent methyltransferase [Chloroflexi bacterium]|nr:SAM-dependent methyltransferase [Chloroflexota bacterium]